MAKKPKPVKPVKPAKNKRNVTIELKAGVGADPEVAPARRKSGDRVRWWNRTDRGHSLEFTLWPFVEPPQTIAVKAGEKSDWYTIYELTPNTFYDYAINPSINPPSGPPGDPGILVGD